MTDRPGRETWTSGALARRSTVGPFPAFTPFETHALRSASRSGDPQDALRKQVQLARVVDRINTGAGFYARIEVDRARAPRMETRQRDAGIFAVEGLDHGLGVILWFEDGYLVDIEGYSFGETTTEIEIADLRVQSSR